MSIILLFFMSHNMLLGSQLHLHQRIYKNFHDHDKDSKVVLLNDVKYFFFIYHFIDIFKELK